MMNEASDYQLVKALSSMIAEACKPLLQKKPEFNGLNMGEFNLTKDDYYTISIQLRALGLIIQSEKNRGVKDTSTYWTLTPYGDNVMTRLRAQKKGDL